MKITIIVFSPSGNTLKVGQMLENSLLNKGIKVNLINSTHSELIFKQNNPREFLERNVEEHDVLMIGGPVYSHHMQYQVLNLIRNLPYSGGKWGSLAIPFTTFGAISSGEALYEAAELLKETGRINVLGMKVNAFHCFTKKWDQRINENMPGAETIKYIEQLATEIIKLEGITPNTLTDISHAFNYQNKLARLKANFLFKEKLMHKFVFPKVKFDYDKCKKCKKCIKMCPVQCLEVKNEVPVQVHPNKCIHCAECFHTCPFEAISLNVEKYKPLLMMGAIGKGFMASHELTKTEVFFNKNISS